MYPIITVQIQVVHWKKYLTKPDQIGSDQSQVFISLWVLYYMWKLHMWCTYVWCTEKVLLLLITIHNLCFACAAWSSFDVRAVVRSKSDVCCAGSVSSCDVSKVHGWIGVELPKVHVTFVPHLFIFFWSRNFKILDHVHASCICKNLLEKPWRGTFKRLIVRHPQHQEA